MPEFKLTQEDAREYSLSITEIDVDGGPDHVTFWLDHDEAVQLFKTCEESIGEWVADYRRFKALSEASHAEFLNEIGPDDDCGYEPDDPRHPTFYERAVEAFDNRDKT